MQSNYCPRIHHGLTLTEISNTGVSYAACCWAKQITRSSGTIDWHHGQLTELRRLNHSNILPEDYCQTCIRQECVGAQSMRQGYLEKDQEQVNDDSLRYLDINIDYTCNLACVTCGPELSTTWRNELGIKHLKVRPNITQFLGIFDQIDLSSLKEIRFWGGEPFLTNTHVDILDFVSSRVDTSRVDLMYNTNGTQTINDRTKGLIERFKFARISLSIDAVGDRFNYIRYPGDWHLIRDNLAWWKENLPHNSMLSLTVTASILNVLYLNEVWEWKERFFDRSRFGDEIDIYVHQAFGWSGLENMTTEMAAVVKSIPDYCQAWIQKSDFLARSHDGPAEFAKRIKEIDHRRGTDLRVVLPEVAELMHCC